MQHHTTAIVVAVVVGVVNRNAGLARDTQYPPPWTGGVHNVFHNPSSNSAPMRGEETISLFVNSVSGGKTSLAYEFAINLTTQQPGVAYTDDVFATTSVVAACGFEAVAQGGARAIADGVFVVSSGISPVSGSQLQVIDGKGGVKAVKYPSTTVVPLYDPFIRVVVSSD